MNTQNFNQEAYNDLIEYRQECIEIIDKSIVFIASYITDIQMAKGKLTDEQINKQIVDRLFELTVVRDHINDL